jgi:hypothetical protein
LGHEKKGPFTMGRKGLIRQERKIAEQRKENCRTEKG